MIKLPYVLVSFLMASTLLEAAPKKKKAGGKGKKPAAAAPAETESLDAPEAASAEPVAPVATAATAAPYGMAGCGLGSLLIKNNSKAPQIGAFFLNATGYQTSAISTGSSNCVNTRTEVAAMEQQVFVAANLTSLSKEAAQGNGDHLNGLAEVLGCEGDEERLRLGQMSQAKYEQLFATQEPDAVLNSYLSAIQADTYLAEQCTKAS